MSTHIQVALARKTLGWKGMWTFGSAASAPMVVLVGGIVATYATTGVVGVPLAFLLVGGVVALLSVGYTAMSRQVPHAAVYYAVLARGLSREAGMAGVLVALLGYNAIQISLYGLFGATATGLVGGQWWAWAAVALVVVAVLGVRAIALSTRLLATILVLSFVVVALFDVAALSNPAGPVSFEGFAPANLFVTGIGGALALCLAAFMGVEAPGSFAEESQDEHSVTRAVFTGVLMLGTVYALSAWAMGVAVGPQQVPAAAADPAAGLPFSVLEQQFGTLATPLAMAILIAALLTSMLAFHSVASRYAFAMAREGVLPGALAATGRGSRASAPIGGSLLQSAIAAIVVAAFAVAGADPVATLFTWLSTLGALGLLALLLTASLSAILFFARGRSSRENAWTRIVAPALGIVLGAAVLAAMLLNVGSLLGAAPGSALPYLIPAVVLLVAIVGLVWGASLRRTRPEVYRGISHGRPQTHAVPDDLGITI